MKPSSNVDMANISRHDVKRTIEQHQNHLAFLNSVANFVKSSKDGISIAARNFAHAEMITALRNVPVDELNTVKSGIRIKTLKDAGYGNVADIYSSTISNLEAINGISYDAAVVIKKVSQDIAQRTLSTTKIKLSIDNKNKYSSALVESIYTYRKSKVIESKCNELLNNFSIAIKEHISVLNSTISPIKWAFMSKSKKDEVAKSYEFLESLLVENYGKLSKDYCTQLNKVAQPSYHDAWVDFEQFSIEYFNIIEETNPGLLGNDDTLYGLPEELAREIQDECIFPEGLLCSLRRYQEWGVKYILHQERVLLGDEMGLGKTVQAIATMVSLKNTGARLFMVVCPASVVENWCREIYKHSRLRPTRIHGKGRKVAFESWKKNGGVGVTTYETLHHLKLEEDFKFSLLIVDEAHYIKNPEAKRSINTIEFSRHAERLLFMTGTAIENKVEEMIGLMDILQPRVSNQARNYAFMSSAPQFRQIIAPVYYRRKREDVLTELPDLIEKEQWCKLNPEEERAYEDAVLSRGMQSARRVSWNVDDLSKSSKATRLKEIVEEAESQGRKVLVFSYFLDTINKIQEFLGDRCLPAINGSVPTARRQEIIDKFSEAPAGSVLLSQIQSGGTGLNIQAASVVIICEPQLKPSIENQAISRSYRMGQARNVLVHRLLCVDTIDERIFEKLQEKQSVFDAFADKSVAAEKSQEAEIDGRTYKDLIVEEIDRINKKRGISSNDISNVEVNIACIDTEQLSDGLTGNELSQSFAQEYVKVENKYGMSSKTEGNKNLSYYNEISNMKYGELVSHLLNKYGRTINDYFTENFSKGKVSRTNEGLYCHHIDEDKVPNLSNVDNAKNYPFSFQKSSRLVYCNLLEHMLLHLKIVEENEGGFLGIGGLIGKNRICSELNEIYDGRFFAADYKTKIADNVRDDFDSYLMLLNKLWKIIKSDSVLSNVYEKEDLAKDCDGKLIGRIYSKING